jgi:uncharacterized protein with PhoU and TrkA domain
MSIRMIAQELYRLEREVERLEKEMKAASFEAGEVIKERLRKVKAERNRLRKVLDGAKEPPSIRQPS